MKRNIITFVTGLIFALILSTAALADGGMQLVIRTPNAPVTAGETFTVTVDAANNPGFSAVQFTLVYDKNTMECFQSSIGSLLNGTLAGSNPTADAGAITVAISFDEIQSDGVLGIFTFRAKSNIDQYHLTLSDVNLLNVNRERVPYSIAYANANAADTNIEPGIPVQPEQFEQGQLGQPGQTQPIPPSGQTQPEQPGQTQPTPPSGQVQPEQPGQTQPTPPGGQTVQPTQPETSYENLSDALFTDTSGHWGEDAIAFTASKGLFSGYPDGSFHPDDSITRAQFVTVLWNMSGKPETDFSTPFTDVANQLDSYRSAIAWAYGNGYIAGKAEDTFDPEGILTRQEAVRILHNYSGGASGVELMLSGTYDGIFTDSDQIADWAKNSLYWGVYHTIISGTSETTLSPQQDMTRAQLSAVLARYLNVFS